MWILILCLIFLIMTYANVSMEAAKNAISLIAYNLLPSLFPFFVLTNMLMKSGKIALLTGFLCGYPAGAMACADLYQAGTLTKEEALRYSMFTSNAGPTFIVGAVGVGMCASKAIGFTLLGVHLVASMTVAVISLFLFPIKKSASEAPSPQSPIPQATGIPFGTQLTDAITSALKQIAVVCGYVLFFAVLLGLLQSLGLQSPVVFSLLEITTGMNCLLTPLGSPASMPALLTILPLAAMLLGFSGLSIHGQIIAILNRRGLPARFFILGKILQALFSGLYAWGLLQIPAVYEWLADSSLAVSASADLVPGTSTYNTIQVLLLEATAVIAVYCGTIKRKLKHIALL